MNGRKKKRTYIKDEEGVEIDLSNSICLTKGSASGDWAGPPEDTAVLWGCGLTPDKRPETREERWRDWTGEEIKLKADKRKCGVKAIKGEDKDVENKSD